MKLIYVAHKFGGNLTLADNAERLTAYLNLHIEDAVFVCPWLPMVRYWVDSGKTRCRGLMLDLATVKRHDALIALSELEGGVKQEWDVARTARRFDLIGDPKIDRLDLVQAWVDCIEENAP